MLDRVERGNTIDLARELRIVAMHAFDCVHEEFSTLSSQATAVVTSGGILSKV